MPFSFRFEDRGKKPGEKNNVHELCCSTKSSSSSLTFTMFTASKIISWTYILIVPRKCGKTLHWAGQHTEVFRQSWQPLSTMDWSAERLVCRHPDGWQREAGCCQDPSSSTWPVKIINLGDFVFQSHHKRKHFWNNRRVTQQPVLQRWV